ncbi:MAG: integrase domain-containing protein [Desulfomicrobium sp.]|nr:integrase domain-containing protein [Pseudomonadota bacterium]MBV1711705.1 integrase domain-containing protein [Desulfomicrobium sp.]MBU4572707.1 integrase domain-containing protein [Pseudomonadota bacterium]MBU4593512.1 integrase domain-containing protein [Pseudomonadota bacterium]MBV1720434.1 integrase domain-containing protein [Desulfomicrobium sp.]
MAKNDSLKEGATKAYNNNAGSAKTQYNHLRESMRFVDELRSCGAGVQKWSNISNKHVSQVVESWQARGLATSTIKENLAGVRATAAFFGNDRISEKNSDFGIENRVYITNQDKSVPQDVYERVVGELRESPELNDQRVAAQLELMREFGLRKEEAFKMNPERSLLKDGRLFVSDGTKGGLHRVVGDLSGSQKGALAHASQLAGRNGNTMPDNLKERAWEKVFYRTLAKYGLSKKDCGASSHGLRHAYAQQRYEQLTGFKAPCKFSTKDDFRKAAYQIAGDDWKKLDQDARLFLKSELGHGPDRDDVISQYLGSK